VAPILQHSLAMFSLEQSCKSARPSTLSARVRDQPAIEAEVKAVKASLGPWSPGDLVNNAGKAGRTGQPLDDLRTVLDTNVLGTFESGLAADLLTLCDNCGGQVLGRSH
jgi:hypothetical protein